MSNDGYNSATGDLIIAQITSRVDSRARPGDYRVANWKGAGLLRPSLVRARLTTIDNGLVLKELGAMPTDELTEVTKQIRSVMS